jgi:PhnB protein
MASRLNPYISFAGNAREAMEFYKGVFGGDLTISTFGELHASSEASEDDLVMHSVLEGQEGIAFMASDVPDRMEYTPGTNSFSMSLSGDDEARLRGYYDQLSDGGSVSMPLEKACWGDTFGMCSDRFGVGWLVNIMAPKD